MRGIDIVHMIEDEDLLYEKLMKYKQTLTAADINVLMNVMNHRIGAADENRAMFKKTFVAAKEELSKTGATLKQDLVDVIERMDNITDPDEILMYANFRTLFNLKMAQLENGK